MGHGAKDWTKFKKSKSFTARETKTVIPTEEEEHHIDIPEIVSTITKYMEGAPIHSFGKPLMSIYRVPKNMRGVHESAYKPKLVSIGPFHHKDPHLQSMEEHKLRFLSCLLSSWTNIQNGTTAGEASTQRNVSIDTLASAMKELEAKARDCYSETFNKIDGNSFVVMMIVDGCFVVELLRLYSKCHKEDVEDPIFRPRWMLPILQRDFLILENQLPFFVLQELFTLTSSSKEPSLPELTLNFFDPLMPREKKMLDRLNLDGQHNHFLALFRSSFVASIKDKKPNPTLAYPPIQNGKLINSVSKRRLSHSETKSKEARCVSFVERQLILSVKELKEAGIEFKKRENHDLLDIEFDKGVLEIPLLLLNEHTGPVFLNFVAYEQCHQQVEPYFTHYVLFFDSLVNSHNDVEILHYNGIINHVLGSDEDVADLFNKLCKEVVYDVENGYLAKQREDVKKYYNTKWHKWRAKLMHDYFSNPWTFSSLLAAVFLLFLTMIQTFFSMFAYFRPPT